MPCCYRQFLFTLSIAFTLPLFSQVNHCEQSALVIAMMQKYHYQPMEINDAFSKKLYKHFLHSLDPNGLFLLKKDINSLNEHATTLDDEIHQSNCSFLVKLIAIYEERLNLAKRSVDKAGNTPVPFKTNESSEFLSEKDTVTYAADEAELDKRWREVLSYTVLNELVTTTSDSIHAYKRSDDVLRKQEPAVRERVKKRFTQTIQSTLGHSGGVEAFLTTQYLNALALQYDPHSAYFSPVAKSAFQESLSTQKHSFGMLLKKTKDGAFEISRLVPGGPAWESGELHAGDILLSVQIPGKDPLDLTLGRWPDQLSSLEKDEEYVKFTIRKKNGAVKMVQIAQALVQANETIIKSYILTGEQKVGYIVLPGFYTEWTENSPLGCANDVAKELLKLKKEEVEGIVLDLRWNGGGSTQEAIGLAGIFIDIGPIAITDMRGAEKPITLKDRNRGTIYDGPLVVLVNGSSASASEIVAAALKDHNRAILVGNTTYGKATGQVILPMDTSISLNSPKLNQIQSDKGYLKITIQKLFRINKTSHQKTGVTVDIEIPDISADAQHRESDYDNALASSEIVKKVYFTPGQKPPIHELKATSEARISSHPVFRMIADINEKSQTAINLDEKVKLNLGEFRQTEQQEHEVMQKVDDIDEQRIVPFEISNHQFDAELNQMNDFEKEINKERLEHIRKDIMIEETFHIISDLIESTKHPK